ncbi:MAG: rod shape-determining protein MreC [Gammaproteobacteria bacterium]|nr:rod shape-determining protein MreC [Gammaproteobacteria bacterium]
MVGLVFRRIIFSVSQKNYPVKLGFYLMLSMVLVGGQDRWDWYKQVQRYTLEFSTAVFLVSTYPWHKLYGWLNSESPLKSQISKEQQRNLYSQYELRELTAQNLYLRQLLDLKQRDHLNVKFASAMYETGNFFSRKIILDQGTQDGVELGMAVIDAQGVVGQITKINPLHSEVTLITDSSIAIYIPKLQMRGVLFGARNLEEVMELNYMSVDAPLEVGDVLFTTGLDGVFPVNYPVARISSIVRPAGQAYAKIQCQPMANLVTIRHVMLFQQAQNK